MRVRSVCAVAAVCLTGSSAPAFAGDHGELVFQSDRAGQEDIWTMGANGRHPVNLTAGSPGSDGNASWRPDGRKIVFTSDRPTSGNPTPPGAAGPDFEVFVMNADGSYPTQLTFNAYDDDGVRWSPDGRLLLVQRDLDPVRGQSDYDLFLMRADGRQERNLTNSPGVDEIHPDWAPHGERIAFASDGDGDSEISTMRLDGSRPRQLTTNTATDVDPVWSPDGRTLAFVSDRDPVDDSGFAWDIHTMRADGGRQTRLTVGGLDDFGPTWSPDGRTIAFATFRDATVGGGEFNAEIYTMRADGSKPRNLTQNPAFDILPDWRPR